jgi:SAM-dependent methyltransferase
MDDARPKIARVVSFIEHYHPGAGSLLELGAGTGTILAGLGAYAPLTGIDRSPQMLEIARAKVPGARLIEADITAFELHERFDVVICVFDTLNHLATFRAWQALFERAHAHLTSRGLFIFDVNTLHKLRGVAAYEPWFEEVEGTTVVQSVEKPVDGLSIWNAWIVERTEAGELAGYHEPIAELGVPLDRIAAALSGGFELLETHDETGAPPTEESERVHFALRRRA